MIDIFHLTEDQKMICARVHALFCLDNCHTLTVQDIRQGLPMGKTSYYNAFHSLEEVLACILITNDFKIMEQFADRPYEEQLYEAMKAIYEDKVFYKNVVSYKHFREIIELLSQLSIQKLNTEGSVVEGLAPDEALVFIVENNLWRFNLIGIWLHKNYTPEEMTKHFLALETVNSQRKPKNPAPDPVS